MRFQKVPQHRTQSFWTPLRFVWIQNETKSFMFNATLVHPHWLAPAAPRPAPALVLHLVCTRVLMTNTIWPNLRSHHNRHPHPHHLHIIPRTPLTCNTSCIIGWKINVPHKPAYHGRNRDLVMVHRWLSDELSTHLVTSKLSTDLHCQIVKCLTTTFL
jgi:hypothetical protein